MTWKNFWNRPMRYRSHWADHMPCQMRSTKQISRQVRTYVVFHLNHAIIFVELDALQLDEEEDVSYLKDLNKVPDFVDEPPAEVTEVCSHPI